MEVALREAMDRTKAQEQTPRSKNKHQVSVEEREMEKILNRTLENKVRSSK